MPKTKHSERYRLYMELKAAQKKISDLEMEVTTLRESKLYNDHLLPLDILSNAPYIIHVKDLSGKYIFTNKGFDSLTGLEKGLSIGKTAYDLFPKDLADTFCFNDKEVVSADSHLEFCVVLRVGEKDHAFQLKKFSLRNENGEIYATCGISMEITEYKDAYKAFKLNESRLEALHVLARMTSSTLQELTDFALEEAIKLTESKIGYLAFMDDKEETLTMYSWSKSAMEECQVQQKK
ncbi:PAS domain-containing protein [Desulfovibrio inopinatus]|uniref:PAS domain-containing protein n=1 Tax=Desulfovibrio inopinatus TaxID=102109 RepID=UPI0003FBB20A|nr:PAS domain-containing protein [Desulfovibrio inopinatus]